MRLINRFSLAAVVLAGLVLTGCSDDDDVVPDVENDLEVITDVKLIFTNVADSSDVVEASAKDPDDLGVEELEILGAINLDTSKTYELTYEITNGLEGEDIGEEIEEEAADHQIFYGFDEGAFTTPSGDGNIDNAADPINYLDKDLNENPVGLITSWTTSAEQLSGGTFTVRLQHQPDIKTSTTGATNGDTDFELTFELNIQ